MIPTAYLTELAQYTNTKIAKVVLNSTYEISSFSIKRVTSSTIELEYIIPLGLVTEVKLIELKSSSGQVLSSNTVYVPITSDTIIKQTITVREA